MGDRGRARSNDRGLAESNEDLRAGLTPTPILTISRQEVEERITAKNNELEEKMLELDKVRVPTIFAEGARSASTVPPMRPICQPRTHARVVAARRAELVHDILALVWDVKHRKRSIVMHVPSISPEMRCGAMNGCKILRNLSPLTDTSSPRSVRRIPLLTSCPTQQYTRLKRPLYNERAKVDPRFHKLHGHQGHGCHSPQCYGHSPEDMVHAHLNPRSSTFPDLCSDPEFLDECARQPSRPRRVDWL